MIQGPVLPRKSYAFSFKESSLTGLSFAYLNPLGSFLDLKYVDNVTPYIVDGFGQQIGGFLPIENDSTALRFGNDRINSLVFHEVLRKDGGAKLGLVSRKWVL